MFFSTLSDKIYDHDHSNIGVFSSPNLNFLYQFKTIVTIIITFRKYVVMLSPFDLIGFYFVSGLKNPVVLAMIFSTALA